MDEDFLDRMARIDKRKREILARTTLKEKPPCAGNNYVAVAIVSPYDSEQVLAFAVAHREPGEIVVDLVREKPSLADVQATCVQYCVAQVETFDDPGDDRALGHVVMAAIGRLKLRDENVETSCAN
jgi:hypothetical protein